MKVKLTLRHLGLLPVLFLYLAASGSLVAMPRNHHYSSSSTVNSSPLYLASTSLPQGTVGQDYLGVLTATGGVPPYTWSIAAGALPPGIFLNPSTGTVSGAPTLAGQFAVTFRVADQTRHTCIRSMYLVIQASTTTTSTSSSSGTTSTQSTSTSSSSTTLQILTTGLPAGTVNSAYGAQLQASGGGTPYTWAVVGGSLPSGLALSTSGAIFGTPTKAGDYAVTFQVTDSTLNSPQVALQNLSISIASASSTGTLCPEMQHGAYYNSGYSLWDNVVGRSDKRVHFLRFKPSKSGDVNSVKWYNSSGSHAVWDACSKYYGSIEPCANHGGQPQYRNTQDPKYPLAFPNGWWPYAAACSTNYSGCYSGGTGGVASFTLMDSSGKVLATAEANQPNVKYGFYSTFPVISLSQSVSLTAGNYYYLKIADTDPNQAANWWSADSYTPTNLFTAAQADAQNLVLTVLSGKSNVADATYQSSLGGSLESNYQPIFALGFTDGSCITQGFAP